MSDTHDCILSRKRVWLGRRPPTSKRHEPTRSVFNSANFAMTDSRLLAGSMGQQVPSSGILGFCPNRFRRHHAQRQCLPMESSPASAQWRLCGLGKAMADRLELTAQPTGANEHPIGSGHCGVCLGCNLEHHRKCDRLAATMPIQPGIGARGGGIRGFQSHRMAVPLRAKSRRAVLRPVAC
jgi:hypothetical protein